MKFYCNQFYDIFWPERFSLESLSNSDYACMHKSAQRSIRNLLFNFVEYFRSNWTIDIDKMLHFDWIELTLNLKFELMIFEFNEDFLAPNYKRLQIRI